MNHLCLQQSEFEMVAYSTSILSFLIMSPPAQIITFINEKVSNYSHATGTSIVQLLQVISYRFIMIMYPISPYASILGKISESDEMIYINSSTVQRATARQHCTLHVFHTNLELQTCSVVEYLTAVHSCLFLQSPDELAQIISIYLLEAEMLRICRQLIIYSVPTPFPVSIHTSS